MKAQIILIKSNFRRRWGSTLLAGLSISISTLLFSTSIAILESTQEPFDDLFTKLNASHIMMLYDVHIDQSQRMKSWFSIQPETDRVTTATPYYLCNGPVLYGNRKIDLQIQLTEFGADNQIQDKLILLAGKMQSSPARGEIWLPKYLAANNQIQINDTLGFPVSSGIHKLIVSGFVADPLYGSGMINPTRAWISAGELPFFLPIAEMKNSMLGIRLKNPKELQSLWERFNKQFTYAGVNLPHTLFRNAFMSIYQMLGNVILIFSVMAITISLVTIRNSIKSAIYADYKLIGVYKSIGFTPKNLIATYILQFAILSVLFIPIGLIGTFFSIRILSHSIVEKLGTAEINISLGILFLLTTVLITVLILSVAMITSLSAAKLKASTAIRTGSPELIGRQKENSTSIVHSVLPLSFWLGLRYIALNPLRNFTLMAVMSIVSFIIAFSINTTFSFENLKNNKGAWGFEESDIQITRKDAVVIPIKHLQLMEMLRKDPEIQSIAPFNFVKLSLLSSNDLPVQEIYGKAYASDPSGVGLLNLQGAHPLGSQEISLCIGTSREFNKKVNDSISVWIEGQKVKFRVTGIYQDASNMGQGFRLNTSSLIKLNPVFSPSQYCLKLTPGANPITFKTNLLKTFGETISLNENIEDRIAQMGIISGVKTSLLSLSLFFIFILILSIANDMISSTKEFQKTFGIMKSIGFTPFQIRSSILWKSLCLASLSLTIAVPLASVMGSYLMSSLSSGVGLVKFPYLIDITSISLQLPFTLLVVSGCSWWMSAKTSNVNPRSLINA